MRASKGEQRRTDRFASLQEPYLWQLLGWLIPLAFGFAALVMLIFAVSGDSGAVVTATVLVGSGMFLSWARLLVKRGRRNEAVVVICASILGGTLIVAFVQPELAPTLAVTTLLAVMVALPYAGDRGLRLLIVTAMLLVVIIGVVGELFSPGPGSYDRLEQIFRVTSLIISVATVMLLIWQFATRMGDMLSQTQAAEERYALAARGANDGLWDWDLLEDRIYYSPRWKEMLGFLTTEIGDSPQEWFGRLHPDDRPLVEARLRAHLDGEWEHFESEHRLVHKDGEYRWMLCRGMVVRGEDGQPTRLAGSQTDVTGRRSAEEALRYRAFHDELTGLPNRGLFTSRLQNAIERIRSGELCGFALVFFDLDRFKNINDSLGHGLGDALLIEVAGRLRACTRPGDTVARLGGDEFIVLFEGVDDIAQIKQIAARVQKEVSRPAVIEGHELFTTASLGIVFGESDRCDTPESLLRDADTAMYRAKQKGKGRYEIFSPQMHADAAALLRLETDLRRALEREEFLVYYQPIISLQSGRLLGMEALVRWRHPDKGLLVPDAFMEVAQETGLIFAIGWRVLEEACHQMADWNERYADRPPLTLSVNVSGRQFMEPDMLERVSGILQGSGLRARQLNLEVTESDVMHGGEGANLLLARLRDMNIGIHIDDFGTGYSSLHALHRLHIDVLKIDRSFVERISHSGEEAEICRTIIALAHNLGMDVVAEGVQTEGQLAALREMGCDYAQGYLFSRPATAGEIEALLRSDPRW